MAKIAAIARMLSKLVVGCLTAAWKLVVFAIDLIDGGDPPETDRRHPGDNHYNFRSNKIDPTRYRDGLYTGDTIDKGISDH